MHMPVTHVHYHDSTGFSYCCHDRNSDDNNSHTITTIAQPGQP